MDFSIDLGRTLDLVHVRVLFQRFWNGENKVYVSDDAVNWTLVVAGDGVQYDYLQDSSVTDGATTANTLGASLPAGTSGRHVRFTTRNWANIYEVEVYSDSDAAVESVELADANRTRVVAGLTTKLDAVVQPPIAADRSVIWSVLPSGGDRAGAATIDPDTGLLSALSAGVVRVVAAAAADPGVTATVDIEVVPAASTWKSAELALVAAQEYADPFDDVAVTATFHGPGGLELERPAFWDGGQVWKVRFAPTVAGAWTVTTSATEQDSGLNLEAPLTFTADTYEGDLALYQHGFLKVEPGSRYLSYSDGTPFFYLGDTHWFMPEESYDSSNVDGIDSQFRYAVDHRVSQGYTVYQSEPLNYNDAGNGSGMDVRNGVTSGLLETLTDLDRKFEYIADAGLVHANSSWTFRSLLRVSDDDLLQRLGTYWQARYGAYPVLWTIAQEVDPGTADATPEQWKTLAEALSATDTYNQPLTAHMSTQSETFTTEWGAEPFHDWFGLQTQSLDADMYRAAYEREPAKPVITYETSYEFNNAPSAKARQAAYRSFQAGAFGYGYGAQGVWAVNQSPDAWYKYGPYYRWFDGLNAPAGSQMTYLRDFYTSIDWWRLTPDYSAATESDGISVARIDDELVTAYLFGAGEESLTVTGLRDAAYVARWFDPRTGSYTVIDDEVRPESGEWAVPSRPDQDDWMLRLSLDTADPTQALTLRSDLNQTTILTPRGTLQFTLSRRGENLQGSAQWAVESLDGEPTDLASIGDDGLLTASGDGIVRVVATIDGEASSQVSRTVVLARQGEDGPPAVATNLQLTIQGRQVLGHFEPSTTTDQRLEWAVYEPDGTTPTDKADISEFGVLALKQEGDILIVATTRDGSSLQASLAYTIEFNDVITNPLLTGATATASSADYANDYRPIKALTSNHARWAGWTSAPDRSVSADSPEWLEIELRESLDINRLELYSTDGYHVQDFDIEYWSDGGWVLLDSIRQAEAGYTQLEFWPITTDRIRVTVSRGDWMGVARISAIEIYNDPYDAPESTSPPAVEGSASVGSTLTADPGTWSGSHLVFGYQWLRDGEEITGQTAASYTVTSSDRGHTLSVRVTAATPDNQTAAATSAGVFIRDRLSIRLRLSRLIAWPGRGVTATIRAEGHGDLTGVPVTVQARAQVLAAQLDENGVAQVQLPAQPAGLVKVVASVAETDRLEGSASSPAWYLSLGR